MKIKLKINRKYTVIQMREWYPVAKREEIKVISYDPKTGIYIYKYRHSQIKWLLPHVADKWLFFKGHDLQLQLDIETAYFKSNGQFNFVSNNPEQIRQYILNNCINPDPELLMKIMVTPKRKEDNKGDYDYIPLFEKEQ